MIPLLAGLAGLVLMSNPRRRTKRRRKNPDDDLLRKIRETEAGIHRTKARLRELNAAEKRGEDPNTIPRKIYGTDDIPSGYAWVRNRLTELCESDERYLTQLRNRVAPSSPREKIRFSDLSKIPAELERALAATKPDYETDEQTGWTIVWDGWEWVATSCEAVAPKIDLSLLPIRPHTKKNPRKRR